MYDDWRGRVYPEELPKRSWFAWYAEHYRTVELNSTFYRLPSMSTVERWAHDAPRAFVYALKLGKFGTHRMKLRDATTWLPNHVDRARGLGHALGPTLVQLPPRWQRNVERLDEFLSAAPRSLRWAVEVRDESWLHDDVFAVLHRHHAALCIHDLIDDHPWERTSDWTYLRFHGPAATRLRYAGRYGGHRLSSVARRIQGWIDDGTDVYAYFNNDHLGHAAADATWLANCLDAGVA